MDAPNTEATGSLQLYEEVTTAQVFFANFAKLLRTVFLRNTFGKCFC